MGVCLSYFYDVIYFCTKVVVVGATSSEDVLMRWFECCVCVFDCSANDGSLYVYDRHRNERTLRVCVCDYSTAAVVPELERFWILRGRFNSLSALLSPSNLQFDNVLSLKTRPADYSKCTKTIKCSKKSKS